MEIATFWNEQHPLSKQAEVLYGELVPGSGNCETVEGELLRASSKIGYDWYNNGWSCNNWSGAVCFLKEHAVEILNLDKETAAKLNKSLDYVHEYSHGEPASHLNYNSIPDIHVTCIHAIIVQGILSKEERTPNVDKLDMHDMCEHDYDYQNDNQMDDDEYDY